MNKILLFAIINFIIIENVWCEVRRDDQVRARKGKAPTVYKIMNALKLLKQMSDKTEIIMFLDDSDGKSQTCVFFHSTFAFYLGVCVCCVEVKSFPFPITKSNDFIINAVPQLLPENFHSHFIWFILPFIS